VREEGEEVRGAVRHGLSTQNVGIARIDDWALSTTNELLLGRCHSKHPPTGFRTWCFMDHALSGSLPFYPPSPHWYEIRYACPGRNMHDQTTVNAFRKMSMPLMRCLWA